MRTPARVVLALLVLSGGACVPDRPVRWAMPESLVGAPCVEEVRTSLDQWGASAEYLVGPPARTGTTTLRMPTRARGVWVVAQRMGDRAPTLQRVDDAGVTLRSFGPGCTAEDVFTPRSASRPSRRRDFDDHALDSALTESRANTARGLVVYAWSPHMPLSVDGWKEVDAAARSLGLLAIPTLIDQAQGDFAEREAGRVGIPKEGLRPITSVELIMRDLQLHAPAILVFAGDRVSPVLPGYRNTEGYRRFLEAFLAQQD